MRYWLMKSEPSDVSIDDLAGFPNQTVDWYGIRNYQARNFMRDQMKLGDGVFFYHSNCDVPGIAGIAEVCKLAYPDRLQFIKGLLIIPSGHGSSIPMRTCSSCCLCSRSCCCSCSLVGSLCNSVAGETAMPSLSQSNEPWYCPI
jgi:hypothetical protein